MDGHRRLAVGMRVPLWPVLSHPLQPLTTSSYILSRVPTASPCAHRHSPVVHPFSDFWCRARRASCSQHSQSRCRTRFWACSFCCLARLHRSSVSLRLECSVRCSIRAPASPPSAAATGSPRGWRAVLRSASLSSWAGDASSHGCIGIHWSSRTHRRSSSALSEKRACASLPRCLEGEATSCLIEGRVRVDVGIGGNRASLPLGLSCSSAPHLVQVPPTDLL